MKTITIVFAIDNDVVMQCGVIITSFLTVYNIDR